MLQRRGEDENLVSQAGMKAKAFTQADDYLAQASIVDEGLPRIN